ncbi:hypothetical protein D3C73_1060760 [compost metagenome]
MTLLVKVETRVRPAASAGASFSTLPISFASAHSTSRFSREKASVLYTSLKEISAVASVSRIIAGLRKYRYSVNSGLVSRFLYRPSSAPDMTGMDNGTITSTRVDNTLSINSEDSSILMLLLL